MKALLIVDMQNDFMPGGALGIDGGDQIISIVNQLMSHFDVVVGSQDWHPAHHISFAPSHTNMRVGDIIKVNGLDQALWPVHCVQKTPGAELHEDLDRSKIQKVVHKGTDTNIDSYSTFFDNARKQKTDLNQFLKNKGVTEIFVVGLTTDYCVLNSALDAKELGYKVTVIEDACRAVHDHQTALAILSKNDITILHSSDIL